jgi:hypothetical protein
MRQKTFSLDPVTILLPKFDSGVKTDQNRGNYWELQYGHPDLPRL